jgi:predicted PurR-regulated permease PerM
MTKQLVVFGTAIMTTLLALAAFWEFRNVVVYILISVALAATVRPLVKGWPKHGFTTRLLLVLVYLISLMSFGFLIFLVARFAIGDIQQLAQTLSVRDSWILPLWLQGSSFAHALVAWLPAPNKLFEAVIGEQGQLVLPAIVGLTQDIGGVASGTLIILFLSIYWSINQIHFERLWLSLLPSEQRKRARDVWRTIELDLGAYIRSELVQSFLAILLLSLGYWALGLRYPMLVALIGALAWLIPVVGAALALILPLLIGLLTGIPLSLFAVLYTLMILIVLQLWVEPRLFRRKWDNPILTLVILLAMADSFGLMGLIVAPPLSSACQILWNLLVSNRLASGASAQVSDLKERQARLQVSIQEMGELPPPLVMSSMLRLADLLEKAEPLLQASESLEHSGALRTQSDRSAVPAKP